MYRWNVGVGQYLRNKVSKRQLKECTNVGMWENKKKERVRSKQGRLKYEAFRNNGERVSRASSLLWLTLYFRRFSAVAAGFSGRADPLVHKRVSA
jgi:hypothetical protein